LIEIPLLFVVGSARRDLILRLGPKNIVVDNAL
jgi:hypothetical protein